MASEIHYPTGIAAVCEPERMRIYFQSPSGQIRETQYEKGWKGGNIGSTIGNARYNTPLAAAATPGLKNISVFSLTDFNTIMQRTYVPNWGWSYGDIGYYGIQVAPYSKLAAAYPPNSDDDLRVYAQKTDDTIQEWKWTQSSGWTAGDNLGKALPGTAITATRFTNGSESAIRVYVQHANNDIVQKCHNASKGWYDMNQVIVASAPFRTAMAITNFHSDPNDTDVNLRLYWVTADGGFWQWCWGSSGFRDKRKMHGATLPSSQIAAVAWDGKPPELRVYYQGGTNGTGITEWAYGKNAQTSVGKTAKDPLPPA
ncbi:uncharacterized protein DSM5745_01585 [Aspergillus mulundensis]|uniref:Fucose-specific lectin n=1 Tax=Aspergillus mulundensis TaxID=1810919 RepID=A0A3D8SU11_9EURO|nr:hypothetical protein DSM5745_01585 [Aspergillus mulundensis]RDW89810.1 hypothetical protein DSM5745_01585 [Aspergillus mulundensis]